MRSWKRARRGKVRVEGEEEGKEECRKGMERRRWRGKRTRGLAMWAFRPDIEGDQMRGPN